MKSYDTEFDAFRRFGLKNRLASNSKSNVFIVYTYTAKIFLPIKVSSIKAKTGPTFPLWIPWSSYNDRSSICCTKTPVLYISFSLKRLKSWERKINNARLNPTSIYWPWKLETKLCVTYFCICNMWSNSLCNKRYGFFFCKLQ